MFKKVINRIIYKTIKSPLGYGNPVSTEIWNTQFEGGEWNKLGSMEEMAHYMVIAGYILQEKKSGEKSLSILDVGCGQGQLYEYLSAFSVDSYTGIDISEAAIRQAKVNENKNARFIVADFEKWDPSDSYNIIVFNESLYYSNNPAQIIQKYKAHAKNIGSKFIVSMCDYGNHQKILKTISPFINLINSTTVLNDKKQMWNVYLFDLLDNN